MLKLHKRLIVTLLIGSSLMISSTTKASDAWPSNFSWSYPQTLTPETSSFQYTWRFHLSSGHYISCRYTVDLYLSRDQTFSSSNDHLLISDSYNEVPAGVIGFTSTVTWYSGWTLPSNGTYYVFLKLSPGIGAPIDSNTSNNVVMAANPIQVINGSVPLPPVDPHPNNGAIEQPLNILLSWSNGGGATNYDVYFGTDSTPDSTEYKGNQTSTTYNPGTIDFGTTYYWRIDAKNTQGTTTGDVWSFTVHGVLPPGVIPIPGRKAHVFDPVNKILYTTTDSGAVERYDVITGNFLSPWTIGGTLGGIDVTPDGGTVLVADQSYDTITDVGYIHCVDAYSGIVTTLEFPLYEGHQFDGGVLSFDPLNGEIYVSYRDGIGIHPINIGSFGDTEDFETNDFSKFPWEHSGDANWTITSQESSSGLYSAKAGSISHNKVTTLQVTLDCSAGNITFYRKVSSESGFDYLKFYIDGQLEEQWSGEQDWDEVSFPVTAGTKTFKWTYSKDSSISRGDDTAWIDDIVFPIADMLQAEANSQMFSNQSNSVELSEGTLTNVEKVTEQVIFSQ